MGFWDLINELCNAGGSGIMLAVLILIIAGLFWISVFLIPFRIGGIKSDVNRMSNDVKLIKEQLCKPSEDKNNIKD